MTTKRLKGTVLGLTLLFLFAWQVISQAQGKAGPKFLAI